MGRKRNDTSGKYTTNYRDADFLDAIEEYDGMAGTTDVADAVGCTQRTAYSRLKELDEKGEVSGTEIGKSLVWTVSKSDK